jgi:glycosyltransferase involved in cell wall biosynthesis
MMINAAEAFVQLGCPVDLVVARNEGPLRDSVPDNVHVVSLDADRLRLALWRMIVYLRRERPVAVMPTMTSASILAVLACRLSGTGTRVVIRHASILGKRQRPWLVRLVYPLADGIIAQSAGMAQDLVEQARLPAERIHVIHNPTVNDGILRSAAEPVDHPWFVDHDRPVVVAVGRLAKMKGFEVLISAFSRVHRRMDCRLVILGEGDARASLEAQMSKLGLQNDIWMPGFLHRPLRYVARSDVFVLSSRVEGFSNAMVEALALGTPVVSTNAPGGSAEILEDGYWGALVPVGDDEAMAEAIIGTIESPPHTRAALIQYSQRFNSKVIARRYMDLLGIESGDNVAMAAATTDGPECADPAETGRNE